MPLGRNLVSEVHGTPTYSNSPHRAQRHILEIQLPVSKHSSFDQPPVTKRLWRYTDVPKFVDLLTWRRLWLTNAEILAADDPHEGLSAVQFPHRVWRSVEEVPPVLREEILQSGRRAGKSSEEAFRQWIMMQEQLCIMTRSGRRDFYVNCWHAADHESAAMWKIYGGPGAGVAIVTNGQRLETSLAARSEKLYLGAVSYLPPDVFHVGVQNAFDPLMVKRASYSYEQEVRLVYWQAEDGHDALANASWNEQTMRYDGLVDDVRPIPPGISFECDLDKLIERVIISPFAPRWYSKMIEELIQRLDYQFPIAVSKLLNAPLVID